MTEKQVTARTITYETPLPVDLFRRSFGTGRGNHHWGIGMLSVRISCGGRTGSDAATVTDSHSGSRCSLGIASNRHHGDVVLLPKLLCRLYNSRCRLR